MTVRQTVYYMALVGAAAGLVCWGLQSWLGDLTSALDQVSFSVAVTTMMGALIGGFTVGFADHWTADRVVLRWVAAGVALGAAAGLIGGLFYLPIVSVIQMERSNAVAAFGRPLTWLIAGGLIGLATGLRWAAVNRLRSIHALLGGIVGGAAGGVLFTFLGTDDVMQALAFMMAGTGITLGVTLAPVLLRDGVLYFISSADPRAQNKYGSPQQEWIVQEGDRFVIGSQGSERNVTLYARAVDVYVPDALVAKRHAILFARGKRFFLQLHPENVGPHGQPLAPLQVNTTNVTGTRELRDGDEIVLGQTLLRLFSRKQAQPAASAAIVAGRRA